MVQRKARVIPPLGAGLFLSRPLWLTGLLVSAWGVARPSAPRLVIGAALLAGALLVAAFAAFAETRRALQRSRVRCG